MASSEKRARPLSMENLESSTSSATGLAASSAKKSRTEAAAATEAPNRELHKAIEPSSKADTITSGNEAVAPAQFSDDLPEQLDLYHASECPAVVSVYGKTIKADQVSRLEETYHAMVKWQTAHPTRHPLILIWTSRPSSGARARNRSATIPIPSRSSMLKLAHK